MITSMDRRSRVLARLFAVCGILLVPWIGLPYAESLAMACFVELPLAALLAWTARRALDWAAPRRAPRPETPA
jgi:hypothetical protein